MLNKCTGKANMAHHMHHKCMSRFKAMAHHKYHNSSKWLGRSSSTRLAQQMLHHSSSTSKCLGLGKASILSMTLQILHTSTTNKCLAQASTTRVAQQHSSILTTWVEQQQTSSLKWLGSKFLGMASTTRVDQQHTSSLRLAQHIGKGSSLATHTSITLAQPMLHSSSSTSKCLGKASILSMALQMLHTSITNKCLGQAITTRVHTSILKAHIIMVAQHKHHSSNCTGKVSVLRLAQHSHHNNYHSSNSFCKPYPMLFSKGGWVAGL